MATRTHSNVIMNGAAAYDLYGNTAVRRRAREDALPREREAARRARQKEPVVDFTAVLCIVAAFCALFVMLFSYVRTYETNTRYSKLEKELSELQDERNQLLSRYDSMLDLRAIELDATERLGMTKPFGGQTVYVNLSGTDRGEVLDAKSNVFEDVAALIRDAFASLGEYLSE